MTYQQHLAMLMKTFAMLVVIAMTSAFSVFGAGADQPKETKSKAPTVKNAKATDEPTKVLITGSHIKREIRRNDRITDGPTQVVVIDSASIQRSGASDLKQLLVHTGVR